MSGFNSSDASLAHAAPASPGSGLEQPLGLTVHSLPQPRQAGLHAAQQTRQGRWKMFAVLAVCAAPVLASYFTYYVLRPDERRNYGDLISAQPALPEVQAQTLDGHKLPLSDLQGQWLLVSTSGGACSGPCEAHLYLQRQLRESLGKEKERLDWVWLIQDDSPVPQHLQPALAQATVLRVAPEVVNNWLQPAPGQQLQDHLYVVDPQGHWMMRMPADLDKTTAPKAKRDLDRLLRASSAWDRAGRSPASSAGGG